MLFKCGLTWEETKKKREQWHDFFALWPRVVSTNDKGEETCAWLQTIQRKSSHVEGYEGGLWLNQYRLKPD